METEELTRLVDGIYKNILDKFNPGARQLINAGKAYLKALHGAAAASRVYVDALTRLARQAQLGTWGGSQDVGSALMRIVEVYKEIQDQEMNILKAFYVDLLVPLETNLEKDTKVVQSEQKKFLQQHKTRSETYSKAAATIKKQRKKSRGASKSGLAMDKELKNMQILEEEKSKLDAFCEQSLKNAMTQERRRYGFVLERQCSLAKHYASFHEVALAALHPSVDEWREVAATREYLPQSVEDMFASRLRQVSFWPEDEENGGSELTMSSQLRKTRSMDSSCLELRLGPTSGNPTSTSHQDGGPPHLPAVLSRARSEVNLHASSLSLGPEDDAGRPIYKFPDIPETPPRPRSMAPASRGSGTANTAGIGPENWSDAPLARALFAYLSSGDNQLSFLEGDLIALMELPGERQKGWQFGENLRTQSSGWFPLAYTEIIIDETLGSPSHGMNNGRSPEPRVIPPCKPPPSRPPVTPSIDDLSSTPGAGSNSNSNSNNNKNNNNNNNKNTPTNVGNSSGVHSVATPSARQAKPIRPSGTLPTALAGGGRRVQPPVPPVPPPQAVTSLHSSNDSGFSNEPPVQPDVDYSDDEAMRQRRRKPRAERIADRNVETEREKNREDPKNPGKDWMNDSWKTIPRDEKSWQLYRSAMDLWANVKQDVTCEDGVKNLPSGRHRAPELARYENQQESNAQSREYHARGTLESHPAKGQSKTYERHAGREYGRDEGNNYENQMRPNPNLRSKFTSEPPAARGQANRRSNELTSQKREAIVRQDREEENDDEEEEEEEEEDVEEEEVEEEEDEEEDLVMYRQQEKERFEVREYSGKYEKNKYYDDRVDGREESPRKGYRVVDHEASYEEKEKSCSSDTDDDSTITIPENGGKVEQIAQKLEQTAQKYAREHSPPKYADKRNDYEDFGRAEKVSSRYDNYILEKERRRGMPQRHNERHERSFEHSASASGAMESSSASNAYDRDGARERERTFEKNPDRNRMRNVERRSSRFERPRAPFEEAPERPSERPFRERRYSEKEEIYGETGRYTRDPGFLEKERGYESNFETKLERSKIIEKHNYQKIDRPAGEQGPSKAGQRESNDSNNNTLKNERKAAAQGRTNVIGRSFDFEAKAPKLVKRTKSFWRFRRDSDVLEGMALWQHRSLVDIPKMIKKEEEAKEEEKEEKEERRAEESLRKSMPDDVKPSQNHEKDVRSREAGSDQSKSGEEPKPAERIHVPEKSEYFADFPTPAERPKVTERSEYRMRQEERTYFVGNVSRKAILEKERKRSLEAKQNMVVAQLKENNEVKKGGGGGGGGAAAAARRNKIYGDDDDGLIQNFTETEASDEESTYSCIVVKDQAVPEKTLLPRTKLRRDADREREREKNTCGPWYDLWGVDSSVKKKKKKQQQP
ncbi:trichohyalin isoform X3 [Cephus cinctus]|uniref:Trichohyalin isoform X3 n=1 Tax=Cephus cinctus TaxID=211228 RepID=A0AAJ7BKY8_CEPCN|nr:trichohyalin isoform X3 [Cephus cinctus]